MVFVVRDCNRRRTWKGALRRRCKGRRSTEQCQDEQWAHRETPFVVKPRWPRALRTATAYEPFPVGRSLRATSESLEPPTRSLGVDRARNLRAIGDTKIGGDVVQFARRERQLLGGRPIGFTRKCEENLGRV